MILVEHGTIITVDAGRRILTDGSVLIDGAEIVQVGPARDVRPPRVPDRVIDARRMVVTPGFVDTHVHLSEHLNRGLLLDDIPVDRYLPDWLIPLYSVMTAEDEEHAALLAGIEMIRTGTTTFCEAGTLFEPAAVAGAMRAPRHAGDPRPLDLGPRGGAGAACARARGDALRANEAMLEQVNGPGRESRLVSAWPLLLGFGTCSEELIRGAKALADRHGVGWGMMHLASHPSRQTRDRLPLATLDAWGVLAPNAKLSHMVYLDEADIALLARRGVKISHCPTAGLKHTKGLAAHARVPEMLAGGVCVSLGGDSGNGSNHFDMLRMMYLVANIYKDARLDVTVMPPETVLEMATIRGAESLLMERRSARSRPASGPTWSSTTAISRSGGPLLNPLNNLVYAATGSSVRSVMIDGRLVLDEGRITTVDERAIYERVEVLAREQVRRAGLTIESKWPTTG